ncbi:hypothetical protein ACY182_05070 [Serratia marcescens]
MRGVSRGGASVPPGAVALMRMPAPNAGHYPLEQPGLDQMVEAVHRFCLAAAER